ncbi:MAG: protocatechuate 4,5-dioxygenase alpha chain [Pseudohongiellaceae bacterium]|jgi:protocatechuate 4,5-dioxygenase alpha chain
MKEQHHEYEDLPGTWVFDAQRARKGYPLNNFFMSLMKEDNRKAFLADESNYLSQFKMSDAQRDAVLNRQWNTMLELGGVVYCLAKLAFTDQHSYQYMAAEMTGMSEQEYVDMMLAGGRSVDGWRSKSETKENAQGDEV